MDKEFQNDFSFNDPTAKRKEFSDKIYYNPPHFNLLRIELETSYKTFFETINREFKPAMSPAYAMVFAAPSFISMMNEAFDMAEVLDTTRVDEICKAYLDAARKKRGVQ